MSKTKATNRKRTPEKPFDAIAPIGELAAALKRWADPVGVSAVGERYAAMVLSRTSAELTEAGRKIKKHADNGDELIDYMTTAYEILSLRLHLVDLALYRLSLTSRPDLGIAYAERGKLAKPETIVWPTEAN